MKLFDVGFNIVITTTDLLSPWVGLVLFIFSYIVLAFRGPNSGTERSSFEAFCLYICWFVWVPFFVWIGAHLARSIWLV